MYSVNQQPVSVLLSWIESGNVAIPEMQRPFVWSTSKVRDLLDSLYRGYPVGYLITWQSPAVPVKGGGAAGFQQLLIDGQQRMTALKAALTGQEVVGKDYRAKRIRICFNPQTEKFETHSPVLAKQPDWISDVHEFLAKDDLFSAVERYMEGNPAADKNQVGRAMQRLYGIRSAQIGIISLSAELDIETVTEIFVRINSKGVPLSSADFVMSKISAYGEQGRTMRKLIDYFAHMARVPSAYDTLRHDEAFSGTPHWKEIIWLRNETEDLYDPNYVDLIRVASMLAFRRARLSSVVSELSGLNPDTHSFDADRAPAAYDALETALRRSVREYDFKQFLLVIRSAGFVDPQLITSQNAMNFAYALFLMLRDEGLPDPEVRRITRRWFALIMLTGRSSGSFETTFDSDLQRIKRRGAARVLEELEASELSDSFWTHGLPQQLVTSNVNNPQFRTFLAAQVKAGAHGFLSAHTLVKDMIELRGDIHHLVPKEYLKTHGVNDTRDYNQVANFALTETAVNIRIGKRAPVDYLAEVHSQVASGTHTLGEVASREALEANFAENAIPTTLETTTADSFESFLDDRRALMAQMMRTYYEAL